MYKVKYYLSGGTLVSKYFDNISDALTFSVYNTPFQSVHSIDKVD